jgi:hypothetical protein
MQSAVPSCSRQRYRQSREFAREFFEEEGLTLLISAMLLAVRPKLIPMMAGPRGLDGRASSGVPGGCGVPTLEGALEFALEFCWDFFWLFFGGILKR